MNVDGNITTGKPWFFHRKIPRELDLEFAIFALTPGIPPEFVRYAFQLNTLTRYISFKIVDRLRHEAEPLAFENAMSITMDDGWAMVKVACNPRRKRPCAFLPHWGSLAIQDRLRHQTAKEIIAELGISKSRLARWRVSKFHPLTLRRLERPRRWGHPEREYQIVD